MSPQVEDYLDWLQRGLEGFRIDESVAVSTTLGNFEVNYDSWYASADVRNGFSIAVEDPFRFLCESEFEHTEYSFELSGMAHISSVFKWVDENTTDSGLNENVSPRAFKASCYLLFAKFAKLNRQAHQLGIKNGLAFSRCNILSYYGDCVHWSKPGLRSVRRKK